MQVRRIGIVGRNRTQGSPCGSSTERMMDGGRQKKRGEGRGITNWVDKEGMIKMEEGKGGRLRSLMERSVEDRWRVLIERFKSESRRFTK